MNNVLDIKDLRKDYGDFCLQDISFSLPEGYIMGLIGPNGAGKTTTIKLIMNLIKKNGGIIEIFGKDSIDHEVEVKSKIGFVYDNPNYYDHLNLRQIKNIIAPFYSTWDEAGFMNLADKFNLPLRKVIKKFSRGMVMKAAIAIALSHHADFIIMDEPTSGLDPVFRRELLELLHELLQSEKKSILFSTHITSDIEKIADFITFILDGKIIFSSRKDEVLENSYVVDAYVPDDDNLFYCRSGVLLENVYFNRSRADFIYYWSLCCTGKVPQRRSVNVQSSGSEVLGGFLQIYYCCCSCRCWNHRLVLECLCRSFSFCKYSR